MTVTSFSNISTVTVKHFKLFDDDGYKLFKFLFLFDTLIFIIVLTGNDWIKVVYTIVTNLNFFS